MGHVTVPLVIEGNRPFVDLTLGRADGSTRTGRFLVDTGGGGFLLAEPLARELGLQWGETIREQGGEFGRVTKIPDAAVRGFRLDLDGNSGEEQVPLTLFGVGLETERDGHPIKPRGLPGSRPRLGDVVSPQGVSCRFRLIHSGSS